MTLRLIIFLAINFGALALGSFFTGKGVPSDWYVSLTKAPWTPPGWVFGFAWTTIMICFSIYLAYLWPVAENKNLLITLFIIQWVLNIAWNPAFFYYHNVLLGLVIISTLTILIGVFLFMHWPELKLKSVLILPYLLWLLIATSLNGYILLKN
ncbi:MAG: tryptophan-rich sensory protein [Lentimicrobiaceae bacterium]|jgi:tryptophan-rich sensory protein|nr:tryptophan-rich sensory protein [Lentimicrobiaceae bacterium]MCP4909124.1 tryptophan-rich sensory protein [Bacteroidota bacterium]MBT3453995.1 tryptophan-rich sensory protein [Lentimicrobiaceae bacterium]MBT3819113.1 tryptophan-rich sensory protein [Lentimicrobiaceae bacterium]MBT4060541.1 tryptophan-rich sensory protein [Lentimicrobiaceae bacterium]